MKESTFTYSSVDLEFTNVTLVYDDQKVATHKKSKLIQQLEEAYYIWVQIKFRKIGWIDNYLYIIENKFQIFLKKMKICINFSNFSNFSNNLKFLKNYLKI